MLSLILYYAAEKVRTKKLEGNYRSMAWGRSRETLLVVGDRGRVLRLVDDKATLIDSGIHANLRAISINPSDGTALIVGNEGTVSILKENSFQKVNAPTTENLRAVSWNPAGTAALIAGNRGTILRYSEETCQTIDNGSANLRRVAWHPRGEMALVTSNCFADEFIPSPNLLSYNALGPNELNPLNEGRTDLIGVDWQLDGKLALVVGYDVIWHKGFIGTFDGKTLSAIQFDNKRIYPVDVSWNHTGEIAALVTATTQPGVGQGVVFLWQQYKSLRPIFRNDEFYFSAVKWNNDRDLMAALGSSTTRTFNC